MLRKRVSVNVAKKGLVTEAASGNKPKNIVFVGMSIIFFIVILISFTGFYFLWIFFIVIFFGDVFSSSLFEDINLIPSLITHIWIEFYKEIETFFKCGGRKRGY